MSDTAFSVSTLEFLLHDFWAGGDRRFSAGPKIMYYKPKCTSKIGRINLHMPCRPDQPRTRLVGPLGSFGALRGSSGGPQRPSKGPRRAPNDPPGPRWSPLVSFCALRGLSGCWGCAQPFGTLPWGPRGSRKGPDGPPTTPTSLTCKLLEPRMNKRNVQKASK
jgi:hypothetical protein